MAYAQHGALGKAVSRLVSPGLAPHFGAVTAKMRSKFIEPPDSQMSSRRPPPSPANVITDEDTTRSIRLFQWGAGAGPHGCRPDFLRQIFGIKKDRPGLDSITKLCNLLANGEAPKQVRPFMGGACGFAFLKEAKFASDGLPQGEDVRPVCSGVVWRRMVSKALYKSEESTFKAHLESHQLAVSVRAGAEVMVHVARSWMAQHSNDPHRILLDMGEGHAHNAVDRHTFLLRASEVAPGLSR